MASGVSSFVRYTVLCVEAEPRTQLSRVGDVASRCYSRVYLGRPCRHCHLLHYCVQEVPEQAERVAAFLSALQRFGAALRALFSVCVSLAP